MSRILSVFLGLIITTTPVVIFLTLSTIHTIVSPEPIAQVWKPRSLEGSSEVCSDGGYRGNWQTVVANISFVYSAYLDPFGEAGNHTDILLLGALKESQLRTNFRNELHCKLFVDDETIITAKLHSLDEVLAEYYNSSRYEIPHPKTKISDNAMQSTHINHTHTYC